MKGLTDKMTLKAFIKQLLNRACVYFTIFMVLYIAIAALVNIGDSALLLEAGRTALFFAFALLLAAANGLLGLARLSGAVRITLHYLIVLFAFYACFLLWMSLRASALIIGIFIFSIVYFAVMGVIALFKSRYKRNLEKTEDYQKQFKK